MSQWFSIFSFEVCTLVNHYCRPQRSCAKVIFLHVCVILSMEGGRAWPGGMCGGGHACLGVCIPGGMCAWWGVCMPRVCVCWGMCAWGACMPRGGMHAMHAPQHHEIRLVNARPVRILLECILVLRCFDAMRML